MQIIPAIDIKDGHCVRLKQGEMQLKQQEFQAEQLSAIGVMPREQPAPKPAAADYSDLGFAPKGEGGPFVADGNLRLGGAHFMNLGERRMSDRDGKLAFVLLGTGALDEVAFELRGFGLQRISGVLPAALVAGVSDGADGGEPGPAELLARWRAALAQAAEALAADLDAAAQKTIADVWSIWNHVRNEYRKGLLFPPFPERELFFDPAVAITTAAALRNAALVMMSRGRSPAARA